MSSLVWLLNLVVSLLLAQNSGFSDLIQAAETQYHYGRSSHVNSSFEGWLFCFLANYTITIIASITVVVASLVVAVATCFFWVGR